MGQEQTTAQPHSARTYNFQSNTQVKHQLQSNHTKEHEGILKLRSTPFPNCVEISNDGMLLFLENAEVTLQELLESRLYTNRLFPLQDVENLIESVVYTMAHLSQSGLIYRDLSPDNIYYCDGVFKLLPNDLIEHQFYDRAWGNFYGLQQAQENNTDFVYLSPELIIALRMRERHVYDFDILSKSTVFILGLILLQATTLLPSSECYDPSNYDIFNNVISDRLDLVEEHYNDCIARIIANMLDYDFNERMDLKELSIWVNREIMAYRKDAKKMDNEDKKINRNSSKPVLLQKSRLIPNDIDKQVPTQDTTPMMPAVSNQQQEPVNIVSRTYARKNMVYINGYDENGREEKNGDILRGTAKNCIYLETVPLYEVEEVERKNDKNQVKNQVRPVPPIAYYPDHTRNYNESKNPYLQTRNMHQQPKKSYQEFKNSYTEHRNPEHRNQVKNHLIDRNPYAEAPTVMGRSGSKYMYQVEEKVNIYQAEPEQSRLNRDYSKMGEKVPQQAHSPYLREVGNLKNKISQSEVQEHFQVSKPETTTTAKFKHQNKFYPSISELENAQRQTETKRIPKHAEVGKNSRAKQSFDSKQSKQSDSKCSINDGSINRIKLEIEKSRKLIEEFRKTQGLVQ